MCLTQPWLWTNIRNIMSSEDDIWRKKLLSSWHISKTLKKGQSHLLDFVSDIYRPKQSMVRAISIYKKLLKKSKRSDSRTQSHHAACRQSSSANNHSVGNATLYVSHVCVIQDTLRELSAKNGKRSYASSFPQTRLLYINTSRYWKTTVETLKL